MFFPPLPRYRIYSRFSTYAAILLELFSGRYLRENAVDLLEKEIQERYGVDFALGAPQARVAIYLAVKAVIEATGKARVVMSPYTIFDVVNMVICAGGRPVFCDIDRETCNLDPSEAAKLIDGQTAAVLTTHLHGLASGLMELVEICRDRNVYLIEDAAQSFGARVDGRPVGTFGGIGIYSYGLMKNVNAFFGGMAVTGNANLARRMKEERARFNNIPFKRLAFRVMYSLAFDTATFPPLFRAFMYWLFRYGTMKDVKVLKNLSRSENNPAIKWEFPESYRCFLSPGQARLVLRQLHSVDADTKTRIEIAKAYHDGLNDIPEIRLPPLRLDGSHIYTAFPIQVEDREALLMYLMRVGRDCAAQHMHNCADLSCFAKFRRDCPNARLIAQQTLLLPCYPQYSSKEVMKTISATRDFFSLPEGSSNQ